MRQRPLPTTPLHPAVEGRCIFSSEASESQFHQEKSQLASHVIATTETNPLFNNSSDVNTPVRFSPLEIFPINGWMTYPSQQFWAVESQALGLADWNLTPVLLLCVLPQLLDRHLQALTFPC